MVSRTDAAGNVYIADTYNYVIKKWTVASNTRDDSGLWRIKTAVGRGGGWRGQVFTSPTPSITSSKMGCRHRTITNLVAAGLNYPYGAGRGRAGNVYIADRNNSAIKNGSPPATPSPNLVTAGLPAPRAWPWMRRAMFTSRIPATMPSRNGRRRMAR